MGLGETTVRYGGQSPDGRRKSPCLTWEKYKKKKKKLYFFNPKKIITIKKKMFMVKNSDNQEKSKNINNKK